MIATLVIAALPWAFAAKLVPMIVGTIALLVAGISLFNEMCRKPTAAAAGSLVDQAQAEVEQTRSTWISSPTPATCRCAPS